MKRNTLKPLDVQTPEAKTPAAKSAYLSYSELPGWMKDNKNILSGYRPEMRDFVKCAKSIFGSDFLFIYILPLKINFPGCTLRLVISGPIWLGSLCSAGWL